MIQGEKRFLQLEDLILHSLILPKSNLWNLIYHICGYTWLGCLVGCMNHRTTSENWHIAFKIWRTRQINMLSIFCSRLRSHKLLISIGSTGFIYSMGLNARYVYTNALDILHARPVHQRDARRQDAGKCSPQLWLSDLAWAVTSSKKTYKWSTVWEYVISFCLPRWQEHLYT